MKFYVDYFGCRSNQAEAQEWIHELENRGYRYTASVADADFALLNTCSVTENAERDVIRYLNRMYRTSSCPWLVVGCTVTKEKKDLSLRYRPYRFFTNLEKSNLIDSITRDYPISSNVIYHTSFKSRFFLKIQDGCNFHCAFCIVPSLRGKSISASRSDILKKASYYVSLGYKEIVLTGINLSSYGYDRFPRETLLDLLKELQQIPELEILRLSSLDPRFIKYSFLKELAALPKIAESFHLAIQSGSDAVLKAMKRGGKAVEILKNLHHLRVFFPDANIGADFIVGFPGESERDFEQSQELVVAGDLNYLHIFPFSPRQGTVAATLPSLSREIVQRRAKEMKALNLDIKRAYRERMVGKTIEGILIEEGAAHSLAVTRNFLSVRLPSSHGLKKRKIKIAITGMINEHLCTGKIE